MCTELLVIGFAHVLVSLPSESANLNLTNHKLLNSESNSKATNVTVNNNNRVTNVNMNVAIHINITR